tara:strand:+ start:36 stop:371 length:336 start_codon:yes stop_codon:yes gene_type:complete
MDEKNVNQNFFKNIIAHIILIIYILLINFMIIIIFLLGIVSIFNINIDDLGKNEKKLLYIIILIISFIISLLQLQVEQVNKNNIKMDVKKWVKIYNILFYIICVLIVIIKQ